MGIKALQDYIDSHCSSACVSVDLLKISRGFISKRRGRYPGSSRFCLVVDAESCLDRLYGGYFSDWVCGGQWNRMTSYLNSLIQACQAANMELVVFFNGSLESQKMNEWFASQSMEKKKVQSIWRHVNNKGTPPPKIWWIPPVFLHGALRMALRQLGVTVACSMDDHEQEVIGYCREHGLQGILAQDAVYTIFDPPRYFSSHNLKLTYKGSLETKEYIMDEIAKNLNLNPNRFCIFAALLGNHILPDADLYDFYRNLLNNSQEGAQPVKFTPENCIEAAVKFVRNLAAVDNLDVVGEQIFRKKTELIAKFKQCVQYYLNGTQDGFLKYRTPQNRMPRQGGYSVQHTGQARAAGQEEHGYASSQAPQIVVEPPHQQNFNNMQPGWSSDKPTEKGDAGVPLKPEMLAAVSSSSSSSSGSSPNRNSPEVQKPLPGQQADSRIPQVLPEIMRVASERHQKGLMCPWIYQLLSQGEIKIPVTLEDDVSRELPTGVELYRPIRQTVYSVLFNLNKQKIIHDNQSKDQGSAPDIKKFEVPVKEWIIRRGTTKTQCEMVSAYPVDWKTPSIERMWLGTNVEDKTRRLRAFLTCMESDTPLMLNTQYVPQQLLLLCCVLRYILTRGRILQRQELDAFLAMSVSPLLHDVQTMQDLKLPNVLPRGIHLASLFMSGVETAVFANDVCGAPIPWNMCPPWHYFDGKLFHYKLLKANNNTPLIDMCDGQVDQVLRVERMRQAIMEGLKVEFARPLLPSAAMSMYTNYPFNQFANPMGMNMRPAGMHRGSGMPPDMQRGPGMHRGGPGMRPGVPAGMGQQPKSPGRGRGILGKYQNKGQSPIDARGGQLEIAGVVVGSWGANIPGGHNRGGNGGMGSMSPRVMSVGGQRRGYPTRGGMMGRPPPLMGRGMMYRDPGFGRGGMRPRMGFPPGYGRGGMRYQGMTPPDRGYYNRGRGGVRGVRKPQIRVRPRVNNNKGKGKPSGRGRGVTVETEEGSDSDEVKIAVNGDNKVNGVYDDAEEVSTPTAKGLPEGIQSPDSGIHGDKSSSDITA